MTQTPIKISTITPCFRMKRYLKLFLDELPKQTCFNELEIVLDHNEPDEEELAWVKEFQEKYPGRIKHIITNPVAPIGTSMNTCIREASGQYLTIWNVDDLRTPNSIELQVKALEEQNADIAFGDYEIVRKFLPSGTIRGSLVAHADIPASEFTRSMIFGPFIMFRKSALEKSGLFDEQMVSGADYDLSIRLAFNGKAVCADGLLGYYLNEGKGASTRPNSKQRLDRTAIELRYGIFDKIDYDYVPEAVSLKLHHVMVDGVPHIIDLFVPNYRAVIDERLKAWKAKGLRKYAFKKVFQVEKIKFKTKNTLKRIRSIFVK
jgi:glycosyltransferase involved in cell wall biosynthesis